MLQCIIKYNRIKIILCKIKIASWMKSLFYEENSTDSGHPGLLTACKDRNGINTGVYGPLDISKSSTFEFLSNLFDEIYTVFPDEMIHLGGDEVELDDCWYNLFLKAIIYKNDM